jgi:hypothetical protein
MEKVGAETVHILIYALTYDNLTAFEKSGISRLDR